MSKTTPESQGDSVFERSCELMSAVWNLADALEPEMRVQHGHACDMFPHGDSWPATTQSEALVALLMGLSSFCNSEAVLNFDDEKGLVINDFEMDVLRNVALAVEKIASFG